MRSLLFCTSYIKDESAWNARYKRWLDFYNRSDFGDSQIIMVDDASPFTPPVDQIQLRSPGTMVSSGLPTMIRFPDRLGRNGVASYPGWWRSFLHSVDLAHQLGVQKIIHIESDAFVLSARMRAYIQSLTDGWTVFWSENFGFPETAIQVICEDQFDALAAFQNKSFEELDTQLAEEQLPFTRINKQMVGDRYSEFRMPLLRTGLLRSKKFNQLKIFQGNLFRHQIPESADFATQVTPDQKLPAKAR